MKYTAYCRKSTDEKDKQVLSIEQQIFELKDFAFREKIEISEFLVESQTAKVPGRKVFGSLIKMIEDGLVDGIVSWNPDRLARNSIDGGKIIYLLDIGKLKDLKFPTHWFDNTPQGKFMLNIAFGQSKYYVDNLSQNVKRGLYYKFRQGDWPGYAPLGYKNDRNIRKVVIDPKESKLVKISFQKFSSGEFSSMREIRDLFFKHEVTRRNGRPLHFNQIRDMLVNPFYFGLMTYGGETKIGNHKSLISKATFDRVQEILKQKYDKRPHVNNFAFTGFIKCKECGSAITAEKHFKNYPKTRGIVPYVYYRCVKKNGKCSQAYIRDMELENQLRDIVGSLSLKEFYSKKLLEMLEKDRIKQSEFVKHELTNLSFSLEVLEKKLDKLLEGYLEEILDSSSYQKKKEELMFKKALIEMKIKEIKAKGLTWLEPMWEFLISAANTAKIARAKNNPDQLSAVGKKVGSNYFLFNKQLQFLPNSPYDLLAAPAPDASKISQSLFLCSLYTKIRTYFQENS